MRFPRCLSFLLICLLGVAPALARQATDKPEPPDGPPAEPTQSPEPPVQDPAKPNPNKPDPNKSGPDKAVPENTEAGAAPIQPPVVTNDKPGHELFVAAADALRRARSLTYHAKAYATGEMFEPHTAKIQADVRMLRSDTAGPQTNGWLVRATGSGKPKSTADAIEFDVVWTGHNIEFVSHTEKKVIEKRTPRDAKNQAYQVATSSRNDELIAARPFSKELATSVEYELKGKETIGGVECDVVIVNYGEKKSKMRYAFGPDHLPRKIERLIEGTIANGSMVLEIDHVQADESDTPGLHADSFKVDIPEGYQEDRLPKQVRVQPPAEKLFPPGTDGKIQAPEGTTLVMSSAPQPNTPPEPAPPEPRTEVPEAAPPASPATASPFELRASTGDRVSLDSLKGNVILIEFGGSWCLPCRDSHNELDALVQRFSDKPVKVLALSCRDRSPEAAIERFKQKTHAFPLLVEADAVARAWNAHTFPSYFVVGFDGTIIKTDLAHAKGTTITALGDAIETYLGSHNPDGSPRPSPVPEPKPE